MKQMSIYDLINTDSEKQVKVFADRWHIEQIEYSTAMELVTKNHYMHRKCPCSKAFGLINDRGGVME